MQIKTDSNGYVQGYAEIGGIEGGVEFSQDDIPKNFNAQTCNYFRLKSGALVYDAEAYERQALLENETEELEEILAWFVWYDNQVTQFLRCERLGTDFDGDIHALDELARQNQERVREIRANTEGK